MAQLLDLIRESDAASQLVRELIRDLAVRGRLSGVGPFAASEDDGAPIRLPSGWRWTTIGEAAKLIRGVSYKKHEAVSAPQTGFVPVIRANNITGTGLNLEDLVYVPTRNVDERQYVRKGDLVIAMSSGSMNVVGKAARAERDFDGAFGAFCGLLRAGDRVDTRYVMSFLGCQYYRQHISGRSRGIGINNLRREDVESCPFPLAPLAEQKRIVAKVDQLMALCDELEAKQTKKCEVGDRLTKAALGALTSAETPEEFSVAWKRVEENFSKLVDVPNAISELRQAILGLAVRGRLVAQDQGPCGGHGQAPEPATSADEHPYVLPDSWRWIPLEAAFEPVSTQGKKVLTSDVKERGRYPVVDQGQVLVRGYSDEEAAVIPCPRPLVVFGDHTRQVKYVDFDFIAGADGTKLLRPKDFVDPRFFYWCLRSFRVEARGYGRHYAKLLEHEFPLPPYSEQQRIAARVDHLMDLCDTLESKLRLRNESAAKLAEALVAETVGV